MSEGTATTQLETLRGTSSDSPPKSTTFQFVSNTITPLCASWWSERHVSPTKGKVLGDRGTAVGKTNDPKVFNLPALQHTPSPTSDSAPST